MAEKLFKIGLVVIGVGVGIFLSVGIFNILKFLHTYSMIFAVILDIVLLGGLLGAVGLGIGWYKEWRDERADNGS